MMNRRVKTPCPGCGAVMFAMSVNVEQNGVSTMSARSWAWATYERKETVDLVCANRCEITVKRGSGERTGKDLAATPLLPLTVEAREAFESAPGKSSP